MISNPCAICPTQGKLCVPGRGPDNAAVVFVGEAPGRDEEKYGRCWIGKAGKELENYVTMVARIDIDSCYLTNLVKFHPAHDRDPKQSEIDECGEVLEAEIKRVQPKIIATLGRYSTQYFLGKDVSLERCHGMPVGDVWEGKDRIIVPMYHPAAGLHNTALMTQIMYDFEVLGRVVRGQLAVGVADTVDCNYVMAAEEWQVEEYLDGADVVAVDTESVKSTTMGNRWWGKTEPWCVSVSVETGTALVVMANRGELIKLVRDKLERATTIIHNTMYDLPILEQMGIRVGRMCDTMVAAYHTQSLPQRLKDLAYRLCGMGMVSYEEMVENAATLNAIRYLQEVGGVNWPDNEPELVWAKGVPHVKKGWALHKRIAKMLRDYEKDESGSVDLRDRWGNVEDRLRRPAEERYGIMPIGDLSEVELDKAVQYTGRDADATLRVWPKVMEVVKGMNIGTVVL